MRTIPAVLMTALFLFALTAESHAQETTEFSVPDTTPTACRDAYVEPFAFDESNVAGVAPGQATPEAAVVHFYASRIRADERYSEVLNPSLDLSEALVEMSGWTFHFFELRQRYVVDLDNFWRAYEFSASQGQLVQINMLFEITHDGVREWATGEVLVQSIGGLWVMADLPTWMIDFGQPAPTTTQLYSGFSVVETTPVDCWHVYDQPIALNAGNVEGLAPGQQTPEAATVHFFASLIRNDQRHTEVSLASSERVSHAIEEYAEWEFVAIELRRRQTGNPERSSWVREYSEVAGDVVVIKLYFEILYDGQSDTGEDDVTLQLIDGRWVVVAPPT